MFILQTYMSKSQTCGKKMRNIKHRLSLFEYPLHTFIRFVEDSSYFQPLLEMSHQEFFWGKKSSLFLPLQLSHNME